LKKKSTNTPKDVPKDYCVYFAMVGKSWNIIEIILKKRVVIKKSVWEDSFALFYIKMSNQKKVSWKWNRRLFRCEIQ